MLLRSMRPFGSANETTSDLPRRLMPRGSPSFFGLFGVFVLFRAASSISNCSALALADAASCSFGLWSASLRNLRILSRKLFIAPPPTQNLFVELFSESKLRLDAERDEADEIVGVRFTQ